MIQLYLGLLVLFGLVLGFFPRLAVVTLVICVIGISPSNFAQILGYSYITWIDGVPPISPINYILIPLILVLMYRYVFVRKMTINLKASFLIWLLFLCAYSVFLAKYFQDSILTTFTEIFISSMLLVFAFFLLSKFYNDCLDLMIYSLLVLGLLQALTGIGQYFISKYSPHVLSHRSNGFMDHPILFGIFLAYLIPLAYFSIEGRYKRIFVLIIYLLAVSLSGSRIGFFLASVFLLLIYKHKKQLVLILFLVLLLGFSYNFWKFNNPIFDRIFNDSNSLGSRLSVWTGVLPNLGRYFFAGIGPGESRSISNALGFGISMESFVLIWILEYGLMLTLILLGGLLSVVSFRAKREFLDFRLLNFFLILVCVFFSSIGVKSQTLWFVSLCISLQVVCNQESTRSISIDNPMYRFSPKKL